MLESLSIYLKFLGEQKSYFIFWSSEIHIVFRSLAFYRDFITWNFNVIEDGWMNAFYDFSA